MNTVAATGGAKPVWIEGYRRNGYFFRQAASLTIATGLFLHLCRAFFGNELVLEHLFTPAFDATLIVPMAYAGITGLLVWRRVAFVNTPHKVFFTWTLIYILASVPFHVYFSLIRRDLGPYLRFWPMWFTYLLFVVYPAFLALFWRLRYRSDQAGRR
jgi:hypothetical protein